MPDKPRFGVLLVTGGMTHQEDYGLGFKADPRAKIIGVTDERGVDRRRAELNRRLAEQMEVPLFPDLDAALRRPDVHLASVCSEFERRARVGTRCAEAGKHVYMDKPLATTMADADQLAAAVRRRGVRSQMFTLVGAPFAKRAKQIVDSGVLGALRAIHCDLLFSKGYPGGAPLGEPRKEHYPPRQFTFPDAKREIWTTAVYSLTLIRWLTGGRAFRSVYATSANYFFEEHYKRDVEDFGALAVTLDGGMTATITAGRIGWQSHPSSGPNFTRLFGSKGSVVIDGHAPRFEVVSDQPPWTPPPRDPDDPMSFWSSTGEKAPRRPKPDWYKPETLPARSDQSMFLDSIEQGAESEVTVADGAAATEAMLAAYESAATGEVVRLRPAG